MKKITCLMIVTVLCVVSAISVSAQTEIKTSATFSTQSAQAGDTIEVVISLENYQDISIADIGGIQVDVSFDSEYFSYVTDSAKNQLKTLQGDFVTSQFNQAKNQYTLMYAYMNADEKPLPKDNKDILSLKFQVKKDIPLSGADIICKVAIADAGSPSKPLLQEEKAYVIYPPTLISNESDSTSSVPSNKPDSSEIIVDIQPDDNLPWDNAVISNTDGKNVTVEKSDDGLIVKGDDLTDVTVSVSKDNETTEVKIPDGQSEVILGETDGHISLEIIESDTDRIVVDIAAEDNLPWDSVVITNTKGKTIKVEKTDGAIVVSGDDLDGVEIIAFKGDKTAEIVVPDGADAIRIEEKNDAVEVLTADDENGSFDGEATLIEYKAVKQSNWSIFLTVGILIAVGLATLICFMLKRKRSTHIE